MWSVVRHHGLGRPQFIRFLPQGHYICWIVWFGLSCNLVPLRSSGRAEPHALRHLPCFALDVFSPIYYGLGIVCRPHHLCYTRGRQTLFDTYCSSFPSVCFIYSASPILYPCEFYPRIRELFPSISAGTRCLASCPSDRCRASSSRHAESAPSTNSCRNSVFLFLLSSSITLVLILKLDSILPFSFS